MILWLTITVVQLKHFPPESELRLDWRSATVPTAAVSSRVKWCSRQFVVCRGPAWRGRPVVDQFQVEQCRLLSVESVAQSGHSPHVGYPVDDHVSDGQNVTCLDRIFRTQITPYYEFPHHCTDECKYTKPMTSKLVYFVRFVESSYRLVKTDIQVSRGWPAKDITKPMVWDLIFKRRSLQLDKLTI